MRKGPENIGFSWLSRVPRLAPAVAALGLVASCSNGTTAKSVDNAKIVPYVMLTPNMVGFTQDHNTRCEHAQKGSDLGDRPCAVLLRAAPTVNSPYVVAVNPNNTVPWPKEAYVKFAGNALKVVCQVQGYNEHDDKGDPPSTIWDVVETPVENLNPWAQQQLQTGNAPFGVKADQSAIYSYASAEWFGKFGSSGLLPQLKACTPQENPGGYPQAA